MEILYSKFSFPFLFFMIFIFIFGRNKSSAPAPPAFLQILPSPWVYFRLCSHSCSGPLLCDKHLGGRPGITNVFCEPHTGDGTFFRQFLCFYLTQVACSHISAFVQYFFFFSTPIIKLDGHFNTGVGIASSAHPVLRH
ncbi:hypothetical protein BDV39DRAFT_179413 [Aspergillus sergii]|uniref:Uncharacterized protein n=1 Tax=Aspergillus sergii TaxID=1034303 RepID=A0A5N6WWG1_9EURO|nr:hypothetical protein BDV39DRAFT_179413 [Aspergillus sergii]